MGLIPGVTRATPATLATQIDDYLGISATPADALANAINAATSAGTKAGKVVGKPGATYDYGAATTPPQLPSGLPAPGLEVDLQGATVKLSATCARVFDLNRAGVSAAVTYQNLTLRNIQVDASLVPTGATRHVFVGNLPGGFQTNHVSLDNITIENVKCANCPYDTSNGATGLQFIALVSRQAASTDTPTSITNISIRRVSVYGANVGVAVLGSGGTSSVAPVLLDNVLIEDCSHDTGHIPTQAGKDAGFQTGGTGQGRTLRVNRCHSTGSADVGHEHDTWQDAVITGCRVTDSWNSKFLSRNFNAALNVWAQRYVYHGCTARNVSLDRGVAGGAATFAPSQDFMIGGDTSSTNYYFGELQLQGCRSEDLTANVSVNQNGTVVSARGVPYRKLTIRDHTIDIPNMNVVNTTGAQAVSFIDAAPAIGGVTDIDGVRIHMAGVTTFNVNITTWKHIRINGGSTDGHVAHVRNIEVDDADLAVSGHTITYVTTEGGTSTHPLRLTIDGVACVRQVPNGYGNRTPINLPATAISTSFITIDHGDFIRCGNSGNDYSINSGYVGKVKIGSILSGRNPTTGIFSTLTAITTGFSSGNLSGTSPVVYQNQDHVVEDVYIAPGTGTITLVEKSVDNASWSPTHSSAGVAAATVRLDPGDYVRVTYSGGTVTMNKTRAK